MSQERLPALSEPLELPWPWAAVPWIGVGMLSWAPFVYAAVRTGARKYKLLDLDPGTLDELGRRAVFLPRY